MPIVLPPKPTTSKALFEAATSLNNKLEKNAKRAEVIADQKAKQAFKEEQSIMEASMRRATMQKKYADFSEAVKGKLLNTAINDIAVRAMTKINESLDREFFTTRDSANLAAICASFIHENGEASGMLYNLKHRGQTQFLSELAKDIKSTHRTILEAIDTMDPDSYAVGDQVMTDYRDKVKGEFGQEELVDSIADRVVAAMKDFMTQNAEDKQHIIDAMQATKDKMEALKAEGKPEEVQESYKNLTRKYITSIRESKKGLFNEMVMTMSKAVVKSDNQAVKDTFMEGAHLDMEKIVKSVATMYTFVETVNSMNLVKVDGDFVKSLLESMSE